MRRNPLVIGFLLLLGLVASVRLWVQFGYPLLLKAQENTPPVTSTSSTSGPDNLGPHAAFGDPAGNVKIAQMVKSKTTKRPPFTIMLDIKSQNVAEDLRVMMEAAQGFQQVVIRIINVNKSLLTETSRIDGLAAVLNSANLPANTLVVFGNELNNLEREWDPGSAPQPGNTAAVAAAGREYQFLFADRFKPQAVNFIPVPAPPDQHNGDYDWNVFADAAGSSVYSGTLVANAYDATAEGGGGIDLYKSLEAKFGGTVVFLIEYGPHPAQSLQQHIDFFANNPPPLPATTLIPDKCQSQDHTDNLWLYYVDGSIYNADGVRINPADCSDLGDTRGEPPEGDYYTRFVYPFYYDDGANPLPLEKEIRQRLANDYTVACVQPAEYETFLGGTGNIQEMFHGANTLGRVCVEENGEACLFKPKASLVLTTSGISNLLGVLRDEREARWRAYDASQAQNNTQRSFTNRFESVEQWFGANNPPDSAYSNSTPEEIIGTHQGPFYKLATTQAQCLAAAEIVSVSTRLCNQWAQANPEATGGCPLEKPILGTNHTIFSLSSALDQKAVELGGNLGADSSGKVVCDAFFTNPTAALEPMIKDMLKVDLYMETAYRPAFLVMATEIDPATQDTDRNNPNGVIHAYEDNVRVPNSLKGHVVDFLVYHVPATLTDFSNESEFTTEDVVTRTIQSFTPEEKTEEWKQKVEEERNHFRSELVTASAPNVPAPQIDCLDEKCDAPLLSSLIDFINVSDMYYALGCEAQHIEDQAESGNQVGSRLAPIDESETLVSEGKPGGDISEAEVSVEIQQYYDSNGSVVNPRGNAPRTKLFNISPYGYRTAYVAEGMRALLTEEQQRNFQKADGYYRTFEAKLGENFTTDEDPSNVYFVLDPETGQYTQTVAGGIKLKDDSKPFSLHFKDMARVFNHSTRVITQLIFGEGTAILNCARNVLNPATNTEDFLRNCQQRGATVASGETPITDNYLNTEVIDTSDCRSFARIGGGPSSIPYTGPQCTAENGPAGSIGQNAFVYDSSYDIASWKTGSDAVVCNPELYKFIVCTNGAGPTKDGLTRQGNAPALIAHKVDEGGNFNPNGSQTACEYVVNRAQSSGVSPKLALAMWGEESGFSAFQVADFGVISQPNARETKSLAQQVGPFLGTINSHSNYLSFLLSYSGERVKTQAPPVLFCNNRNFPARLKTFYSYFSS